MNIAAFLLAIVAGVLFLADYFRWYPRRVDGPGPRITVIPLGLFFLTAAWVMQLIWQTPHVVHFGTGH